MITERQLMQRGVGDLYMSGSRGLSFRAEPHKLGKCFLFSTMPIHNGNRKSSQGVSIAMLLRCGKRIESHRPFNGLFGTAFPLLNGRFPTLMRCFPNALMGRFPSRKSPGKQPIKKSGIKRFLRIISCEIPKSNFNVSHFQGKCLAMCAGSAISCQLRFVIRRAQAWPAPQIICPTGGGV